MIWALGGSWCFWRRLKSCVLERCWLCLFRSLSWGQSLQLSFREFSYSCSLQCCWDLPIMTGTGMARCPPLGFYIQTAGEKVSFPEMIKLFYLFIYLFVCLFLPLHLRHIEIPGLGVELELQLLAFATVTATRDPSCVCNLRHSLAASPDP